MKQSTFASPRRLIVHAIAIALSLGGISGCARAQADEKRPDPRGSHAPAPSASASASALPAKDIAPPASSARGAWDPDFSSTPVPTEPSKRPERSEWAAAPLATEARVTYDRCKVQRIREWYRVSCKLEHAAELISGSIEDVTVDCRHDALDSDSSFCDEVYAIFPARRGDRRSFEVFALSRWGSAPDALISEQFIDGDPLPLVSVQGLRWGF